ncbi:MAG: hypothetical protein NTX96_02980 [Candidatus Zambryskibacteria bacterium]|nr:hypothetical protein [Candidatus Zambryskibacteria bacterium]
MEQLINSYKKSGDLHHAYFLVGEGEEIFLELKNFLGAVVGVETSGNPDFWHGKYNTLNIESAREIANAQERKSFEENPSSRAKLTTGLKVFIIQADFITEEAQNSLLKVFEEPTSGTHFFIISPQDILLPTLRSRMHIMVIPRANLGSKKRILDLGLSERLAKVKEITDAISDEDKTKQDAIAFLNQIETELYKQGVEKSHKALEICEFARASLYDRGAPIKMILENVMLSV